MRVWVLIPAAGSSTRFGSGDKLSADLSGQPLLLRTVSCFVGRPEVAGVVVAGPFGGSAFGAFFGFHGPALERLGVRVCRGGESHRWQTVRAMLGVVPSGGAKAATHVAVHDGARPCVPSGLLDRVFTAAASHDAVVPALPVAETLKRVAGDVTRAAGARITETVPRAGLCTVQTPQVFRAGLLRRAYAQGDLSGATDDAQLVERLGNAVCAVRGDPRNLKVTLAEDLAVASASLPVS